MRLLMMTVALLWMGTAQAATLVQETATGKVFNDSVDFNGEVYNGDWYLPNGAATGAVYLQHGFTRGGGNYRDLAIAMMDQGMMVLSINAPMSGGNESLATRVADVLASQPPVSPDGRVFPANNLVLSGHSAGALHVSLIAERLVQTGHAGQLAGLVLFDPVNSFGPFGRTMNAVASAGLPVRAVTANPSVCNLLNDTKGALRDLPGNYVGIKLTDRSTHVDAEGRNTDIAASLACGIPREQNIVALRDFGVAWAGDMLTGTFSGDFYPGGQRLNALLNDGDAKLIKDASGAWITVLEQTVGESFYGSDTFTVTVPDTTVGKVEITTRGGSGSADLYVRRNGDVSVWRYDCRDKGWGTSETCELWGPGEYQVMVKAGFWGYSGVQVRARYIEY
jgi:hypothetical protein